MLDEFYQEIHLEQGTFYVYENAYLSFLYFQKYKDYVLDLYRCGFASVLLEELNRFHEKIEGTMPSSSIEKYQLYLYIGALFNIAIVWLSGDDKTSPEEMAQFFLRTVSKIMHQ